MASKLKVTPQKAEALEKDAIPLLDLSDAAVKALIRSAKMRGYVTQDQITALLSSEEVKSERIEDILAKFSEMGVNVVETEEADPENEGAREGPDDDDIGSEVVAAKPMLLAVAEKKAPSERTDDPVRMYLREMGSVELLSREREVAIAKRIEAGREAMIAGLCESPLTFQAVII
jgi:RNA polymerase primary sigma factor